MAKLIKKNWQILPLILIWVALWRYYQGKTIDLMWLNTVLWHKVVQAKKFHRGNCSCACTGLETVSGLIGELTGQPFVLPVKLTSHIRSHWKWNTSNFPCCSVVSVAISMLQVAVCAELWSEIQGEIQLEPLFTIHALDIGVHAVPITKLKIFTLLLV